MNFIALYVASIFLSTDILITVITTTPTIPGAQKSTFVVIGGVITVLANNEVFVTNVYAVYSAIEVGADQITRIIVFNLEKTYSIEIILYVTCGFEHCC